MAIKNWRKIDKYIWEPKTKNGAVWLSREIDKNYRGIWVAHIENNFRHRYKEFKSRSQALEYIKAYMRRN